MSGSEVLTSVWVTLRELAGASVEFANTQPAAKFWPAGFDA